MAGLVKRALGKADSERLDRIGPLKFCSRREDTCAIDAATEKKTKGDVAHQTAFNRLGQQCPQLICELVVISFGQPFIGFYVETPVALNGETAARSVVGQMT